MNRTPFDPSKKTVYVLYENDGDHEMFYDKHSRINQLAVPYLYFKQAVEEIGYNFQPTFDYIGLGSKKDVAYIVSLTTLNQTILQSVAQHPKEKCILTIQEPWIVYDFMYDRRLTNYFGKIGVMFDDLVDNINYFKFFCPQQNEELAKDMPPFEQRKFSVMVQSHHVSNHRQAAYSEREKAAEFLSKTGEFDLYGKGWEGYSSWKGWTNLNTIDVLKNYKFSFVYENMFDQNGYISNRIFDAIYAKSLPIYLGPKNISDYIPFNCFINLKDFNSYEQLYCYLKNMDRETYDSYIDAAQAYIKSSKAEVFSSKQFARTMMTYIQKVT